MLSVLTNFFESALLWASVAYFTFLAAAGVIYGGLRIALWMSG